VERKNVFGFFPGSDIGYQDHFGFVVWRGSPLCMDVLVA
jgi:hypothetical protein